MTKAAQILFVAVLTAYLLDGALDVLDSWCPHTIINREVPVAGRLNGFPFQGHIIYPMEGPRQCR